MSTSHSSQTDRASAPSSVRFARPFVGMLGLLIGTLALGTPLLPDNLAFLVLGLVILIVGVLQNVTGFALFDPNASGRWFSRGSASIVTGILLMALPNMTFVALALILGCSWIISGVSNIASVFREKRDGDQIWTVIDGLVNCLLGAAIAAQWPLSGIVSIGIYVGLRYIASGWSLLIGAPRSPVKEDAVAGHPELALGLPSHPYLTSLNSKLTQDLVISNRSDRIWRLLFLMTFFAIHAARMDVDWTFVGILSPAGAVLGDIALAIVLAYGLVAPTSVAWRTLTRRFERRAWTWYLARFDQGRATWGLVSLVRWWLTQRMRGAVRRVQARGSATAAMGWGLQRGLPIVAILMAVTPLWGVSWFFNTETWVTGGWEVWAERRTDRWREEMTQAVQMEYGDAGLQSDFLQIFPEGLKPETKDFRFIVIGDTGEGDASQHILRDQFLLLGQRPDIQFLVVSSDVIYPLGSMKDYEPKFYLPFKGFHKPIYAVPGNHDWYDALEAFNANFLEPKAARAAMRARREADHGLTSTTETRIDEMIREADRLRQEYQVRAARQRAPYFEIHTDQFSLIVVDTGILRRIDDAQMRWLDKALERGRGKFKMVLLGHPLYAQGRYQANEDKDFAEIHAVLKKHAVDVVMAGDTHDFEFYKEVSADANAGKPSMYHFVNGGGGAYLSIGTALSWPKEPAVKECGHYPRADALTASLDANTPTWKQPLWHWVKNFNAWPSSPEVIASAFNYDRAPFFQSFMEVRVEGSTNSVRFLLYGSNGRLRWRDLFVQDGRIPHEKTREDFVEFTFPIRRKDT